MRPSDRKQARRAEEPRTVAAAGREHVLVSLARNTALLGALWFLYTTVRRITANNWVDAFANANRLLEIEQALGLPSEADLQARLVGFETLLRASNAFYFVHFPATAAFLVWAWVRYPDHFIRIRNTLIVATLAGLAIHLVFPLAPPRMLPGFIDTALHIGPSPYDLAISKGANQLAAMPSLHVGWALLVAVAVISAHKSRWRFLALAHPAITAAVVIITANHYWADALIAIALVLCTWYAAALWRRASLGRRTDPVADDTLLPTSHDL